MIKKPADQFFPLRPGQLAPNFYLSATSIKKLNQKVSLNDFRGLPVVLIFYPSDWSPICGNQLALFNKVMPKLNELHANLLGISVDSFWSHLAFSKYNNLGFPLLSDFEPKGSVAKAYGVFDENTGLSRPAVFIINPQGRIHCSYFSPSENIPGIYEIINDLDFIPKQLSFRNSQVNTI